MANSKTSFELSFSAREILDSIRSRGYSIPDYAIVSVETRNDGFDSLCGLVYKWQDGSDEAVKVDRGI